MYIGNGRQPETTESARKPANTGLDRQEETNISKELVPGAGIEPARLSAPDFKSGMSTSFIIRACKNNRLQPFVTHHQRIPERAPGCPSGAESARTQVILSLLRLPISPFGR